MATATTLPLLIVFGAGGHGRVVADAALAAGCFRGVVASDRNATLWDQELLPGVPILPPDSLGSLAAPLALHIAIGNNDVRRREALSLAIVAPLTSVIHPNACISPSSSVGAGCLVAAQAVIGPLAKLGEGVIVNHAAVVDHDCRVAAWAHIAPGAMLGGAVAVGAGSLVGAGSVVLRNVSIGASATLGAGGVALAEIPDGESWAGVPARHIERANA